MSWRQTMMAAAVSVLMAALLTVLIRFVMQHVV
jgi:hypothetical protein